MAQAMEAERRQIVQRDGGTVVREITWLNILRVLQLFKLTQGYDPEYENFDQAPFFRNALAVAGGHFIETDFIEIVD